MHSSPSSTVNEASISLAIAQATNYVLPTVDQIFEAGQSLDQVNQSLFFDWKHVRPNAIFPYALGADSLYYNLSFLWPQLQTTGLILDFPQQCAPQICSLLFGTFLYEPNFAANVFFATFFALFLAVNIPLAVRQRTWTYMGGMLLGLLCECLGYIGRILILQDDFDWNRFYLYIICLTMGPAFLSFSIYTCLARIVVVYGPEHSRVKPMTYTYIFATCDVVSLALQGVGGGLAATAGSYANAQNGINIMIAGLAFQVFSLTMFMVACAEFAIRVYRFSDRQATAGFERSRRFRLFLVALALAIATIYVRCVYRVAELQYGFQSRLANDETLFLVLEGCMISVATIALTLLHPSIVFGHRWDEISRTMKDGTTSRAAVSETSDHPKA